MQLYNILTNESSLSIALGFFDGVHLGHQKVIKSAVDYARTANIKSAVITFKDHPCCYFWGVCPKYILTKEERAKHIEALGVDYLFELDFDETMASMSAKDYLEQILVKHFHPSAIFTGFNHTFGANKSGDTKFLAKNSTEYGYEYFEIPPQIYDSEVISSTKIRNYLALGETEKASEMLGYNFNVKGTVIEGKKLGRTIGYPTANINYPCELIDLPFGVYSVNVTVDKKVYKGMANFGIKPTVSDSKKYGLEVHILNFDRDIYGQIINIEFCKMIRKEQKFSNLSELKEQIRKDISAI